MKLSVAIVSYQQADTIRQAVESTLDQAADFDFEVIVGDDASTDGTVDILRELEAEWPDRVHLLLAETNHGDAGLTNFLDVLARCRGDYVALLDGDDYWTSKEKLQRQVDFLDAHPECAMCGHRVEHVWDSGYTETSHRKVVGDHVYDVGDLMVDNFAQKISMVHRRENIEKLPEWYATTKVASADWLMSLLCGRYGKVGFLDEVMGVHRLGDASLTAHYGMVRMLSDQIMALEQLRPDFPDHGPAIDRAQRVLRWKLRLARVGGRPYEAIRRLSARMRRT